MLAKTVGLTTREAQCVYIIGYDILKICIGWVLDVSQDGRSEYKRRDMFISHRIRHVEATCRL